MPIARITQTDPNYPEQLNRYLKTDAPETIWCWGDINLLGGSGAPEHGELWALFCSGKCPGEIILKAHDLAQRFRRLGKSTIGGFHSPDREGMPSRFAARRTTRYYLPCA